MPGARQQDPQLHWRGTNAAEARELEEFEWSLATHHPIYYHQNNAENHDFQWYEYCKSIHVYLLFLPAIPGVVSIPGLRSFVNRKLNGGNQPIVREVTPAIIQFLEQCKSIVRSCEMFQHKLM